MTAPILGVLQCQFMPTFCKSDSIFIPPAVSSSRRIHRSIALRVDDRLTSPWLLAHVGALNLEGNRVEIQRMLARAPCYQGREIRKSNTNSMDPVDGLNAKASNLGVSLTVAQAPGLFCSQYFVDGPRSAGLGLEVRKCRQCRSAV
ncbi:hypothetical protein CLCR_02151 [Cladophialophora carrionii]|uniref:Uncharacterized protein n=1 Tax=Cladophialophora carrionii TaxID=86049 RepID=A0A1C1CE06_9EURO|nr:hypothetical protein CLCR_02151 [Cladophialophora carrionii]